MNAKSIAVRQPGAAAKVWTGPGLPAVSALSGLVPWLLPLAVLLLWQLAAWRGWLPPQILPSPSLVFATLVDLVRGGEIGEGLRVSLFRIATGLAIGVSLGLAVGGLIGCSRRAAEYFGPTITALAQIPTLGWVPILILIFGLDEIVKYLIIAKACFVPTVLATMEGIRGIPAHYREVGRVLRLRRWTMLTRLIAPAALPTIFGGLRLAISYAWIALIVVEMLAATEGIGYTMVWGRTLFQTDIVIAGMIVVGLIGLLMDFGLTRIERRLRRWDPKAGERPA